jgi:regulatory protein YycH of two-component signal transduction system YycFG
MEDFDNTISKVQSYKERIENIYADADTYIDADQKNEENNYGKSDQLAMKSNGTKALIKFDLSRIPQSAKITDAKITLTRIGGNTNTITIQRVLNNARNEGAGNSSPSAFGETNYIYLSYPDSAWFGEK